MQKPSLYLAGPDVFEKSPSAVFEHLSKLCEQHGFIPLVPSDGGISAGFTGTGDELAQRIYDANIALIHQADAVLANLEPFRGELEPDSGTVFEVGYAAALRKPVAGYNVLGLHEVRVERVCGKELLDGQPFDKRHGYLIETMSQGLNLMLSRSASLHETAEQALAQLAARFRERQAA